LIRQNLSGRVRLLREPTLVYSMCQGGNGARLMVLGMGLCRWRLEERFAWGWRQREEDSRLRLMASAFVNTSARQVGAPRRSEVRSQRSDVRGQKTE